ncbi:acyl-CoA N-acyltransferase [Mycena galopus ATCC 62051]|nr:acyl-CoA N-acyltransferase [Mycena galopus ATCC 62051]
MPVPDILPSQSGRILLIRPREEDDAAVAALRSHPETHRHLTFESAHLSVEEARALRITRAADERRMSFNIHVSNESGSTISTFGGTVGLSHINHLKSCEVGILINPEYFRRGLATDALYTILAYAFETMKLDRARLSTAANNVGMRGLLEKAGVMLEGIARDDWSDGKGGFSDVCLYGILEQEWAKTIKAKLEGQINRAIEG